MNNTPTTDASKNPPDTILKQSLLEQVSAQKIPFMQALWRLLFEYSHVRNKVLILFGFLIITKAFIGLNALFITSAIDGTKLSVISAISLHIGAIFLIYKALEAISHPLLERYFNSIETTVRFESIANATQILFTLPTWMTQTMHPVQVAKRLLVQKNIRDVFFLICRNLFPALLEIAIAIAFVVYLKAFSAAVLITLCAIFYILLMLFLVPKMMSLLSQHFHSIVVNHTFFKELVQSTLIARIYGSSALISSSIKQQIDVQNQQQEQRVQFLAAAELIPSLFMALTSAFIFYITYEQYTQNHISLGVFSATMTVSITILSNLKQMVWIFAALHADQSAIGFPLQLIDAIRNQEKSSHTGAPILPIEPTKPLGVSVFTNTHPHNACATHQASHIHSSDLNSLTFEIDQLSVHTQDKTLVHAITQSVPFGSKIFIVGAGGSGKSTFLKALANLLPHKGHTFLLPQKQNPQQPHIQNVHRTDSDNHPALPCSAFSYVPQDYGVVLDTVAFNLKIANPFATDSQMQAVLQQVDLWDTLLEQQQLETLATTSHLSGGQLQRLSIARALLSQRPIMLLDEPTASVDVLTEQRLLYLICTLPHTVFCVIHRIHALPPDATVWVFDQGRLVSITTAHHYVHNNHGALSP